MKLIHFIALLILTSGAWSQVGINNTNPNQALDVNGKVKIGNDGVTPTEGTLRYGTTGDFEGYTSGGWRSFTQSSSSIIPGDIIPIIASSTISPNVTQDLTLYDAFTLNSYVNIPSGKYFMVTSIVVSSNTTGTTGVHALSIGPRVSTPYPISYRSLDLKGDRATSSQTVSDPYGFLVIIRPGEKFSIYNSNNSNYPVDITVRGFILDPF